MLAAALTCFAEQGYHGTSIRDIAGAAGLSVPGLYHYFPSKQAVLVELMAAVMDELLVRTTAALESAPDSPSDRFDALVAALVRFHFDRQAHAFVASTELRSLDAANRARIVRLRDEQQRTIDALVEEGCAAGVFSTPFPADASRAVAVLCVGAASWFRPSGPLPVDELVARHVVLARALVGAR